MQLHGDAHYDLFRIQVNEGLRVYRALRPDALPFYQEDAMLSMGCGEHGLGTGHQV